MGRNLLPRLKAKPSPANIPIAKVGEWTVLAAPGELAKLEHAVDQDVELRRRVQSIPNPWARLLLFHNALQDPQHPARDLVQNELLDALEFVWQAGPTVRCEFVPVRLEELRRHAQHAGSSRVEDFAEALAELAPTRFGGRAAVEAVTVALLAGQPVFASSPYTILFTAEDAAQAERTGPFFRYAAGAPVRRLADRPPEFQRYIAKVLIPQLSQLDVTQVDSAEVQRCVTPWLKREVQQAAGRAEGHLRDDLLAPLGVDWRGAAEYLQLQEYGRFGGLVLYAQRPGAQLARSEWRLRAQRSGSAPIVVHPPEFNGVYFSGAPSVTLPSNLAELSRDRLPGLEVQSAWVYPEVDWLASELLLLGEPVSLGAVQGFRQYQVQPGAPAEFAQPRMLLPLKSEFFRYFRPEDVDDLLAVEVLATGDVVVSLRVPVGGEGSARTVLIRKVYEAQSIKRQTLGPGLALWPSFSSDAWHDYAVFRHDRNTQMARYYQLAPSREGQPLASERQEWMPTTSVLTTKRPPEALELIRLDANGVREAVGVLLPRYRDAQPQSNATWEVGVDFGTSNTVVSVKEAGGMPELLSVSGLVLPLTEAGESTDEFLSSFFLPAALPPKPFGTALVCVRDGTAASLAEEPLGLRANIPVTGRVQAWETTQVVGDLKWTARAGHAHHPASFIRQVVGTVLAAAIQRGISPARVRFSWAYPRAFSAAQVGQFKGLWTQALETFASVGVNAQSLGPSLDESQSALRHFFNAGVIAPAQGLAAIVDVGGGTSDIAVYGYSRAVVLDSIMLGGRNLTGRLLQGQTAAATENPFARAFLEWADRANLPESEKKSLRAYRADNQEHLAFSYLVGTRWFELHRASFIAEEDYHEFQLVVLYFFGALAYYLGLTLRAPSIREEFGGELPFRIILAGNGSRYLHWLTDFETSGDQDPFRRMLARLIAAGAGAASDARLPIIELSDTPKEEVARGLIASAAISAVSAHDPTHGSVVGEAVRLEGAGGQAALDFAAESRFTMDATIKASDVQRLRWPKSDTEIERFHQVLIEASRGLASRGHPWTSAAGTYADHFREVDIRAIQHDTANRLQYLTTLDNGFQGSLFVLEASVVLEALLKRCF